MDKIVIGELHYISAVDEYEWPKQWWVQWPMYQEQLPNN
jgi:hypothetical protein